MKRKVFFILIAIISLISNFSIAHKGRTDADGGHYDNSTGEYHYHHGYSEHQHLNGICPYESNIDFTSQDGGLIIVGTEDDGQEIIDNYEKQIEDLQEQVKNKEEKIEELNRNIEDNESKIQNLKENADDNWLGILILQVIVALVFYNIGYWKKNK